MRANMRPHVKRRVPLSGTIWASVSPMANFDWFILQKNRRILKTECSDWRKLFIGFMIYINENLPIISDEKNSEIKRWIDGRF